MTSKEGRIGYKPSSTIFFLPISCFRIKPIRPGSGVTGEVGCKKAETNDRDLHTKAVRTFKELEAAHALQRQAAEA